MAMCTMGSLWLGFCTAWRSMLAVLLGLSFSSSPIMCYASMNPCAVAGLFNTCRRRSAGAAHVPGAYLHAGHLILCRGPFPYSEQSSALMLATARARSTPASSPTSSTWRASR